MWQTRSNRSSLPRKEQQQAVEQTPATTGSAPAVKDTCLGGRRRRNTLQHFRLTCQSKGVDGGANDQWYADPVELDTGSALSIIPDCLNRHNLSRLPLSPTLVVLKTHSGEHTNALGVISVDVEYNGQDHNGKALVVKTDGRQLFGRDCEWLQHIKNNWSRVHRLASNTSSTQRCPTELLERHSAGVSEDRGCFRHCKGRLHLLDGAKARFFKAQALP